MVKHKNVQILDLPFISILDKRPKAGQFILMAWDIGGYCGYESTYWNPTEEHCRHAVLWMPLPENHAFTRRCAVVLKRRFKLKPVILKWSAHFSVVRNGKYISEDNLKKIASEDFGEDERVTY